MVERKRLIKWLLALGKLALVVLLAWMIRAALAKGFADLKNHTWHVHWGWLLAAGCCYLAGTLPNATFWAQVIAATDHPVSWYTALRAFYVSAIAKYIPGKAMVLVLRAGMMRSTMVPVTLITVVVFFETLTNMAVGAFVGFANLLPSIQDRALQPFLLAALVMFVLTGLPTLPPVFKLLLHVMGLKKVNPSVVARLHRIGMPVLVTGWITQAAGWWLQGLGLWATLAALGQEQTLADWPRCTVAAALSVGAGFLALLPAGIGAREFVNVELLRGICDDSTAVVATILWRLISVVADVAVSSILYMVRPRAASLPESAGAVADVQS